MFSFTPVILIDGQVDVIAIGKEFHTWNSY